MRKISIVVAACLGLVAHGLNFEEFKGFASPESVYVTDSYVYVSNVGKKLEPLAKDNDGFISKLDRNGKVIEKEFLNGINAPKGMAIIGHTLYVVDIDVLRGFNLDNKKEVFNMPIKGAIFLNDIANLDNNTLFVSDTGTGVIHKVNLKNKTYSTFVKIDPKYAGPNGLLLDGNTLITVTYDPNGKIAGRVLKINLSNKKMSEFSKVSGALDGVAFDKQGNLIVSSWGDNFKGKIYKIDKKAHAVELGLPAMFGPADIFYKDGYLWVPKMGENAILKIKL